MSPAQNRTKLWRYLAQTGFSLSVILIGYWQWRSESDYSLTFQLLWLVPLFLPTLGIFRGNPYTYAWSGFIACLYLLWSSTHWYISSDQRLFAAVITLSLLSWILGAAYYAKFRGQELNLSLKALSK